ncbi:MAG: ABC transporter permease, partial [Pseudoflavonifractor sp.]
MGIILTYLIPILASTVSMSTPLVLAAVGGAFSVRGGIMALGLESMMMCGAFGGVLGAYYSGSVAVGLLCGMLGGLLISIPHAILSVRYKVNQVISGIGLNLLATAATTLLMQLIWGNKGSSPMVPSIESSIGGPIPILSNQ